MPTDYKVSLEYFLQNDCFSAKHFKSHFVYFLENKEWLFPDMNYEVYRYKVVVWTDPTKKYHLKAHFNGNSRKYVTLLQAGHNKELATLHCDIHPHALLALIYNHIICSSSCSTRKPRSHT